MSEDLINKIEEIRNNEQETTWVVAGFENGDPKKCLVLEASGTETSVDGGLKECLREDAVQYALYRVIDIIDAIKTVKFVYISWYVVNIST